MEKVIVLLRKAPYGSVYSAEAFRTIMGIGVFEMDICVLFVDDGVFALLKDQNPGKLDMKPLGDGFPMLPEFGVNRFVVHRESLIERGLNPDDLVVDAEIVDGDDLGSIFAEYQRVLPF